uniref:Domain of unknown function DB domain-containing protein n=1 Tax=Parascaris univalens TaxID=6257 RepID=A0A915CI23_PARUN
MNRRLSLLIGSLKKDYPKAILLRRHNFELAVEYGDLLQLTAMYFKQDACPLDAMKEMQFCAAQGRDHRQCCIRNGVTTTLAGAKCLVFCDQRPGQQFHISLIH